MTYKLKLTNEETIHMTEVGRFSIDIEQRLLIIYQKNDPIYQLNPDMFAVFKWDAVRYITTM